jgi:hypothetical protein
MLDPVERSLLARIAAGDDAARDVLADHWIAHGDAARGTFVRLQLEQAVRPEDPALDAALQRLEIEHAARWQPAGYPREHVGFERGFTRVPLVITGDPTDELFRASPLLYRELALSPCSTGTIVEARAMTPDGEGELVLLKTVRPGWPARVFDRDILQPNAVNQLAMLGRAVRRDGLALVLPGGRDVASLLGVRSVGDPETGPRPRGTALGNNFALAVARGTCHALAQLHAARAVHGQLTPENIIIGRTGTFHVVDLYPAPVFADTYMPWAHETGWYIAPELVRGEPPTERSDLFSLALIACTLVDGVHPAHAASGLARFEAIRDGRLALPPMLPGLDRVLRRVLFDRLPATAVELAAALDALAG